MGGLDCWIERGVMRIAVVALLLVASLGLLLAGVLHQPLIGARVDEANACQDETEVARGDDRVDMAWDARSPVAVKPQAIPRQAAPSNRGQGDEATASIHGRVLNADGEPEVGAIIRLECEDTNPDVPLTLDLRRLAESMEGVFRFAMTDGKGKYAIDKIKTGLKITVQVHLIQDSFWEAARDITFSTPDGQAKMMLPSSVREQIKPGRVMNEDLLQMIFSRLGGMLKQPRDPLTMQVFQTAEPFVLAARERRQFDVRLGGYCTVRGRVRDQEGNPISGVKVALQRPMGDTFGLSAYSGFVAQAAVGDDGSYRLEKVPAGQWVVGVLSPGVYAWQPSFAFPRMSAIFPGAGEKMDLDLEVYRGLSIKGRLILLEDLREKGRVGVFSVHVAKLYQSPVSQLNEDGTFCISPLVPGQYHILAWIVGGSGPMRITDNPVEVGACDIVLRLDVGSPVTGTVVDRSDHPRAALLVVVSETNESKLRIQCNPDGSFNLNYLPPGRYDIFAKTEDGEMGVATDVDVASDAPSKRVVIKLEPAGRVALKIIGPRQTYYVRIHSRHWKTRLVPQSVKTGVWLVFLAPEGALDLKVFASNETDGRILATKAVTVKAGTEVRAEIAIKE
jgi:carboxypeptidase family protein